MKMGTKYQGIDWLWIAQSQIHTFWSSKRKENARHKVFAWWVFSSPSSNCGQSVDSVQWNHELKFGLPGYEEDNSVHYYLSIVPQFWLLMLSVMISLTLSSPSIMYFPILFKMVTPATWKSLNNNIEALIISRIFSFYRLWEYLEELDDLIICTWLKKPNQQLEHVSKVWSFWNSDLVYSNQLT